MSLTALLLPLLLAQAHTHWEASVRTEVRARTALGQDAVSVVGADGKPQGTTAADLELRPQLQGAVFTGPWTLSAGYTPTLWLREAYLKPRVDHAHVLNLDGSWAREGRPRVFLDEYLNFGVLDVATYGTSSAPGTSAPAQPPGPVPLTQQLTSDTQVGVDWPVARDLALHTTAGYTFGGGVDPASQYGPQGAILPLQSSPRAAARLTWLASRLDTLAFSAIGRFTSFQASDDCFAPVPRTCVFRGARVGMGELSVRYLRQLAAHTSVDVTGGLTAAYGELPTAASAPGIAPMGEAGISHRQLLRTQSWDFRVSAMAGPYVDRLRGTVYERLEANGAVGWSHVRRFDATLRSGVAQSLTGIPSSDLLTAYGEAGAGYRGEDWWRVDLTARETLVSVAAPPGASAGASWQSQWFVGLSATFTALSAPQTVAAE